ncbi:MAG: methionine synthase [Actinomycetota bacterium]
MIWPVGAATGIGSMPGDDPRESAAVVAGELPDLVHIAELPGRGAPAGMIGRTAALLSDLYVDLQPAGWRIVDRPGIDHRRAVDALRRDLDELEEAAAGYTGLLKLQAAGPWTASAGIELHRGDRVLADRGAVRDLAQSLGEGLRLHAAEVGRRVPGASIVLQLDEPSLPAVIAGHIRTASGFGALAEVPGPDASDGLRTVVEAVGVPAGVHCCAADPPLALFTAAGAAFASIDAALLARRDDDVIGEFLEAGGHLLLGLVPTVVHDLPSVSATTAPARELWRRLSYPPETLAQRVTVTPACGLAGASPAYARAALARARDAGRALAEAPEES